MVFAIYYLSAQYWVVTCLTYLQLAGSFDEVCGCAALSEEPGELCVNFAPGSVNGCADTGPDCKSAYWVLGTDYVSYTVIYDCVQILELREETAWILTRDPNPAPDVVISNKR